MPKVIKGNAKEIILAVKKFYTVKKEIPTLAKLLVEFKNAIKFDGSRDTLRIFLSLELITLFFKSYEYILRLPIYG